MSVQVATHIPGDMLNLKVIVTTFVQTIFVLLLSFVVLARSDSLYYWQSTLKQETVVQEDRYYPTRFLIGNGGFTFVV